MLVSLVTSLVVSIHAPARGATLFCHLPFSFLCCFNPRPRTGGDHPDFITSEYLTLFQSTPPHGGRHRFTVLYPLLLGFNPRPRTGGDAGRIQISSPAICFNPRPRTGGDRKGYYFLLENSTFQSTPPHGGRHYMMLGCIYKHKFQSTPPHGGRPGTLSIYK